MSTDETRRVGIYRRVARDTIKSPSQSMVRQEADCRAFCEREGLSVVDVYTDLGVAASAPVRPAYQRLLDDARAGRIDGIVVSGLDRLTRSSEDIADIAATGVMIATPTMGELVLSDASGRLVATLLTAIAEAERVTKKLHGERSRPARQLNADKAVER